MEKRNSHVERRTPSQRSSTTSINQYRSSSSTSPSTPNFHPSNPFASLSRSSSHRQTHSSPCNDTKIKNGSKSARKASSPHQITSSAPVSPHRRQHSLTPKYPGDTSHLPLVTLTASHHAARRSSHLSKRHLPGPDLIDTLDFTPFGRYHHSGPYDATLLAPNSTPRTSPIEAVRWTNAEALKATPKEFVKMSLERKLPLMGVASVPPGEVGSDGRRIWYEEGADLMREKDAEGGAYKRWDHVNYHPDDLKGKGEPYFLIDRELKHHKRRTSDRRCKAIGNESGEFEMRRQEPLLAKTATSRHRSISNAECERGTWHDEASYNERIRRDVRHGSLSTGLRGRFGSLRRKIVL